jgi:predicted SAM-dependent methyltransferase
VLSRQLKAAYYSSMWGPLRVSGWLHRQFQNSRNGTLKVQLGPGQRNYLEGWTNVDANLFTAKIDIWADLRASLPFRDASVDVFYSHHVIEHLPDSRLPFHFSEMYRCLKPGGMIRVGGPNGDSAARKLIEGDAAWFTDFPEKRESVGGRYANFILCKGEHLTILTESYLTELSCRAGFVNIRPCVPVVQTFHGQWIDRAVLGTEWESTPEMPHTLIIEAEKPLTAAPLSGITS